MTQVTLNHCHCIIIKYKPESDKKAAKFTLEINYIKKSYPVPKDTSTAKQDYALLLEQFYTDLNMELPKNGFNIFNIGAKSKIAIPIQN